MLENKCEPLFRHRRRRVDPARAMEIDRAKRAGEDRTVHSEMPLRFRSDIAGGVIVVPLGYDSDLASIPQFAWSIFMASDSIRITEEFLWRTAARPAYRANNAILSLPTKPCLI